MIRRFPSLFASLAFCALLALTASPARADSDDGIVRVKSAVPMQEAIVRIKADIAAKGIKFFSEIDQSKLAADAVTSAKVADGSLTASDIAPNTFLSTTRPTDPGTGWVATGREATGGNAGNWAVQTWVVCMTAGS